MEVEKAAVAGSPTGLANTEEPALDAVVDFVVAPAKTTAKRVFENSDLVDSHRSNHGHRCCHDGPLVLACNPSPGHS